MGAVSAPAPTIFRKVPLLYEFFKRLPPTNYPFLDLIIHNTTASKQAGKCP